IEKRAIVAAKASGRKPVFRLRTALGREIEATGEHPFLTVAGWRKLKALKVGDAIASARSLPSLGTRRWRRHELVALGGLIAEGNLCHPNTFYFYTQDEEHCAEFVRCVEQFPNTEAVVARHHSCFSVRVRRIDRTRVSGAVTWARDLGIWGAGAREERLP